MADTTNTFTILDRIASRQARVAIIGLGYVGLPLAVEFARAGFAVTGIEVDDRKIEMINAGRSYVLDVPDALVADLIDRRLLAATGDGAVLQDADAVIICVPTPLSKTRDPDISYIVAAVDQIMRHAHRDMLVVLESTTYPGTTDELLLSRLEAAGFRVGQDVFLAFSPERVDPANPVYGVRNTPKVIAGATPACLNVAMALYSHAVERLVPVSSTRAAEMVKLLENTFRAVNIGLVNEMALICNKLGLDVWEVIDAASTKPYGFMPFYPGPGLGGHCLPIDPLYLSWKLRTLNYTTRFIDLADTINTQMPHHVVDRVTEGLNAFRKAVNGSRVLILGVAYKPGVNDARESPAFEIIRLLLQRGASLVYHDPYVPHLENQEFSLDSVVLTDAELAAADCVVIVTNHPSYDWEWVTARTQLIVDTRNAVRGIASSRAKIVKL